jgi:D-glycero-alpha-D-manno-heptose-7-phosphate kinase
MIITRSPLRISIGGGGTDLPSYYEQHGGFVISAAIDKFVYITLHHTFEPELIIKYSKYEHVHSIDEVEHPIIREALRLTKIDNISLEIVSMADIPAGTGLGSSGSFTTALLKGLHSLKKEVIQTGQLAEEACEIELGRLKEPIGKQDQYIAAFGGLTCFQFRPGGKVEASPLHINEETLFNLESNMLLFFTGMTRSASRILKDQDDRSRKKDQSITDNLHFIKELGHKIQDTLEKGDLLEFARLMDEHWQRKKQRSAEMTNPVINEWYDYAIANGALGGKLIGAGGGGFLMFYSRDPARLRTAMRQRGIREVRFRFDFEGTKVVVQ